MKRILLVLCLIILLTSCSKTTYTMITDDPVDGYHIYRKDSSGILCNTYYEDIYYSGEMYNYGFRFKACSHEMAYFIKTGDTYLYLQYALDDGLITIASLLPHLQELPRHSEVPTQDEADYYWLDFHISGTVVRAYAGGECDQAGTEQFIIDDITYAYSATGCLKDHILYMEIDHEMIPLADLIADGTIDSHYLIPLLTEVTD